MKKLAFVVVFAWLASPTAVSADKFSEDGRKKFNKWCDDTNHRFAGCPNYTWKSEYEEVKQHCVCCEILHRGVGLPAYKNDHKD